MALEIRADDVLPWGKYVGNTLRNVFIKDEKYFNKICEKGDFLISERTRSIIVSGELKEDISRPTFSRGARLDKIELRENDVLTTGPFTGYTLKEIFDENESYFRYLVQGKLYFVSEKTFDNLTVLKYGESFLRHKSREEISNVIDGKINGFHFSETDIYSEKDIVPYLGEPVETQFSDETSIVIKQDIDDDKYHLQEELEKIYGKWARYRDGQEEAILAVLNGKKTLVVQHTGWGKSLVYFMSIKKLREMGKGPAIIISPLLALMHNQVDSTEKFGLNVKAISSDNQKEWKSIYVEITINKLDALIISPERLANEDFMNFIKPYLSNISLFVVDEAHCISDWGHDFRPDFRRIIKIIKKLPKNTPVLATTATANDRVVRDIKYQLGSDLEVTRGTMERTSINIDVLDLGSDYNKQEWLLRNLPNMNGVGIVYCLTIRSCEELVDLFIDHGINAKIYHGQLKPEDKVEIEQEFYDNKIDVLVATIAFGMGIDKPDISFVIHYQQPASAIAYYQQIGRAGRDSTMVPTAYAILLAGDEDNYINRYFIMNAFPTENEMNSVIEVVTENPGIKRNEIMEKLGVGQGWADKVLKYLLVNGDLYKAGGRYYKTSKEWDCDMKRARIVSWFRWRELRRFNTFIDTKQCYMKFLRDELDDENTSICGHCANCIGHHFFD